MTKDVFDTCRCGHYRYKHWTCDYKPDIFCNHPGKNHCHNYCKCPEFVLSVPSSPIICQICGCRGHEIHDDSMCNPESQV